MSPFIVPSLKKIEGANLEKIDKVDFRHRQIYRKSFAQTLNLGTDQVLIYITISYSYY